MAPYPFTLTLPRSLGSCGLTLVAAPRPPEFPFTGSFRVRRDGEEKETWAQADPLDPNLLWLDGEFLMAGDNRLIAEAASAPSGDSGVEVADEGGSLTLDLHGERFTRYHYARDAAPARPYFYPVLAGGGVPVTRNYPIARLDHESHDHPHHRSLWVAHGDVNGADNWSEEPGHARTEHVAFDGIVSGPILGGFRERTRWVTASGAPLLHETRDIRVFQCVPALRVLDLTLRFTPAEGAVTFGDTKEGGLIAVRVATAMDGDKGGTLTNADGATGEANTWGKRSLWCDTSGGGLDCGITLMDHPDNPRFPTYWHVRDYGLMTANPFGVSHFTHDRTQDGSLTVPAGETARWRYRIVVHAGTLEESRVAERIERLYNAFTARLTTAAAA